ncbi:DUF1810 domain-containing protein [Flavobacterium granuli]|uniref:Uncharacterized protein (DUF1810 family) n=1 Tax=Flavobacterium granuli TaxID=280093 RepID=A0A1M5SB23_9FLAO|nr:DUF1810 domain-containing protein [Flavobacterium granuli]PRZ21273.1 uncharacterized protein (DUF1810 family) [Flavobacterium granuli]SHH35665.1 Uncharacterized protein, DUF1810 family [Flavobacterium granuli]
MNTNKNLIKFLDAQNQVYLKALSEIKNGKKETHWMWSVFPQTKGLNFNETANSYHITSLEMASSYLAHPILGKHLIEISEELLNLNKKEITQIFGSQDNLKLHSCMTIFANIENTNPVFLKVLDKYFSGLQDERTLELIR